MEDADDESAATLEVGKKDTANKDDNDEDEVSFLDEKNLTTLWLLNRISIYCTTSMSFDLGIFFLYLISFHLTKVFPQKNKIFH